MRRKILKFESLSTSDQKWLLEETWCNQCQKADLGISNPVLYIDNGKKLIEGNCLACNSLCKSEITETKANV